MILAFIGDKIYDLYEIIYMPEYSALLIVLEMLTFLIIMGLILTLIHSTIRKKRVDFNIKYLFAETIKDYVLKTYYLFLTLIITTILGRFTGIYSNYNLASAYDLNLSFDFNKMAFDSTNNLIP